KRFQVDSRRSAFAYVFEGQGTFRTVNDDCGEAIGHPALLVFGDGDYVEIATSEQPVRLLLVSGKPLHEPIARYGPFVMNTREEIQQALIDLRNGTFVRESVLS
ncbi:MAG: pirin-like C-terminal cupin domain-containing protein, partial [Anaerolineae bacterium]